MRRLEFGEGLGEAAGTGATMLVMVGQQFEPHATGALYWPDEDTLLVADLHFEKGATCARGRQFLPPYDTRATLNRLEAAIAWRSARRVIALGDSFHTRRATERMLTTDRDHLTALQRGRDWVWISGNHDGSVPASVGGEVADEISLRGIRLRHEPSPGAGCEIVGHLHPVARIAGRASLRARCFAGDGSRLVMPAFGALAGGLNILDAAFAGVLARSMRSVWMCGRTAVYRVSPMRLLPDC